MTELLNIYMSRLGMELDSNESNTSQSNISTDHHSNQEHVEEEKEEDAETDVNDNEETYSQTI